MALLSRDALGWRFDAHAFPEGAFPTAPRANSVEQAVGRLQSSSGHAWTAIGLGDFADREWTLLLPGESATWANRVGFEQVVETIGWSLRKVATREREDFGSRFQRTLHGFTLRLARERDPARLYALVLRTVAAQVHAGTGALAVFSPADDALAIVETVGYPRAIVQHLRIRPGEGLIGRAFETGKAVCDTVSTEGRRRLRYRTDSYLILPIRAGAATLAVLALTDRTDGEAFDARDFTAARLLVSAAASAFGRERLRLQLAQVTELATIDPLTGLFNRRSFETRLQAEVERARRQRQELALLLIDVDDFKRVNDTRGHLEGDRLLREVADLLRDAVRIFDVCARFGGEEFVIVMPAASVAVAQDVAERVRARVERAFGSNSPPVTVSIGVALLAEHSTGEDLIHAADRALIAAKGAGKNLVLTED